MYVSVKAGVTGGPGGRSQNPPRCHPRRWLWGAGGCQGLEGAGGERVCGGWQLPSGMPGSAGVERAGWPVAEGSAEGPVAVPPPPGGLQALAGGLLGRRGGGGLSPGHGRAAGRPLWVGAGSAPYLSQPVLTSTAAAPG